LIGEGSYKFCYIIKDKFFELRWIWKYRWVTI